MSAIIAIIPIVLLFVLMLGLKMAGHKSAFITLLVTIALALFVAPAMGFVPKDFTFAGVGWAVVEGVLKAVFPILIIILMAIFSYNVLVESKEIEVIKNQFTSFSDDKGVTVLMLVWGFGGLLEGMAGFGTAVAIPAAILISLGYKPVFSALVALIANTVPTGFGAVGVPVITLCNEVAAGGVASPELIREVSTYCVVQLSPLFIILPFIILDAYKPQPKCHWTQFAYFAVGGWYLFGYAICCCNVPRSRNACHYRQCGSHHSLAALQQTLCTEEG